MGASTSCPPSRVVHTKYGSVQGQRIVHEGELQVDAFLGIPFATPPVGELRFKKPLPPDTWEGIRKCVKFSRRCVQKDYFIQDRIMKKAGSEDCLYLNVFTPVWQPPPEGFPVMVFVHGGGFSMHDAATYGVDGICKHLVRKGVIVVTIQYRLGFFGFFSTGDDACPGNLGLWDQTEALKWVQVNIEAFSGNKHNVTIFGQSAGGCSVDLLSLSPHSQNLFHKVCPMAGVATAEWAFNDEMLEKWRTRAKKLLKSDEKDSYKIVEGLRRIRASRLAIDMNPSEPLDQAIMENKLEVTPVIDGDFLTAPPSELRKIAPPKPRLSGITKLEAALFLTRYKASRAKMEELMDRMVPKGIPDRDEKMMLLLNSYLDSGKQKCPNKADKRSFLEAFCDRFMGYPTYEMLIDTIKYNGDAPIYNYVFDYQSPKAYGILKALIPINEATHCTELDFLFGKGIIWPYKFTDEDMKMVDVFTTAFTNFAKYGDPNGGPLERQTSPKICPNTLPTYWSPVTESNPEAHYVFDLTPRVSTTYFHGRPKRLYEMRSNQ